MPDAVSPGAGDPLKGSTRPETEKDAAPIVLKYGIAALAPVPLAHGAFGQVYLGKMLNPLGLLAERILLGEESPRWLGLTDLPFEEPRPEGSRLPAPMQDPAARERVIQAATRLWREYRQLRSVDPRRADRDFKDWLGFIDPLLRDDRTIAVKVLQPTRSPEATGTTGESLPRFIKENELLRRLEHPGIVRRFGLVQDGKRGWCLLLEFIEGETLDERLGRFDGRRMPLPDAARVMGELARAVEYIHSKGIVHRDLKPENVMIRRESGSAVITDFGIGKWVDETPAEQLTMAGVRLGTPKYMAPEQASIDSGAERPTAQTDVYQLSTLLFEMVTGHAAYEGLDPGRIFAWLADPARRHPTYVQDFLPGISQELEALIEVGREKDPRARWTIAEFRLRAEHLLSEGCYERRRHRRLASAADLGKALGEARVRRKEALWKEHAIERELARADVRERMEAVRKALQEGDWKTARGDLDALRRPVDPGRSLPGQFAPELDSLEKALAFGLDREEAARLLVRAETEFAAGRFSDVAPLLSELAPRMVRLPRRSCAELHERHRKLYRTFEARHSAFVELFTTLRSSFVEKIRADYGKLHELYGAGSPVADSRIMEVLRKVGAAKKNLATIDPDKVGRLGYEAVRRELEEQETALRDLRARLGETAPPGANH